MKSVYSEFKYYFYLNLFEKIKKYLNNVLRKKFIGNSEIYFYKIKELKPKPYFLKGCY